MTEIRLYLDEDRNSDLLITALQGFGIDALNSAAAGMNGKPDDDQMAFAIATGRVMYTANVRDFSKLHATVLGGGGHHPGIVVVRQRDFAPWQQARRLQRMVHERPAESMVDALLWLALWDEWAV